MSGFPGFKKTLKQIEKLVETKNRDYAGTKDPFKNIMMVETLGVVDAERGIAVRLSDKLSRAINLIDKENVVVDEKMEDTLVDAATYLIIWKCLREHKRKLGVKK